MPEATPDAKHTAHHHNDQPPSAIKVDQKEPKLQQQEAPCQPVPPSGGRCHSAAAGKGPASPLTAAAAFCAAVSLTCAPPCPYPPKQCSGVKGPGVQPCALIARLPPKPPPLHAYGAHSLPLPYTQNPVRTSPPSTFSNPFCRHLVFLFARASARAILGHHARSHAFSGHHAQPHAFTPQSQLPACHHPHSSSQQALHRSRVVVVLLLPLVAVMDVPVAQPSVTMRGSDSEGRVVGQGVPGLA